MIDVDPEILFVVWGMYLLLCLVCFHVPTRIEKEKVQYFSELNDLRASVDHLSNEKVN